MSRSLHFQKVISRGKLLFLLIKLVCRDIWRMSRYPLHFIKVIIRGTLYFCRDISFPKKIRKPPLHWYVSYYSAEPPCAALSVSCVNIHVTLPRKGSYLGYGLLWLFSKNHATLSWLYWQSSFDKSRNSTSFPNFFLRIR